jgi:two-component sensor histidine kinase
MQAIDGSASWRPALGKRSILPNETGAGALEPISSSRSLVWRLSNAALAVALPLVILTLVLVAFVANEERQAKRALLVSAAHALANVIELQVDRSIVLANALSHSALLAAADVDGFQRQVGAILTEMPETTLVLNAPDGRAIASSPGLPAGSPLLADRSDLVQRAFAAGQTFVSDVKPGVADRSVAHVSVETPVFQNSQPIYEISLILPADQFASLLHRQNYPQGWLAGVIDRNGMFIARLPVQAGTPGSRASAEFVNASHSASDLVVSHRSIDGERIVSAYAPTPYGWTVGVAASYALIEGESGGLLLAILLAAAALVASLALSYFFGRRLAARVHEMQTRSEQLVAGAPIEPQQTGVREIDALSQALAKASSILRRRAEQQKRAESDLRKSEEHFRVLADSLPQLVWTATPDGRIEYTNARRELYGSGGMDRADWDHIIHPDDRRATAETWLLASESGSPYEMEHRLMVAGRGYVWHLSRAVALLDARRAVVRWYGTTTDINDSRLREQHIRSLVTEVNHRSRNLLAVAQAIARRSVTRGESAQDFEKKFSERLLGLVASQDLLTGHDWRGVPLEALVKAQTSNRLRGSERRVAIQGPALMLNPPAAQTLGLALQELWSNALKYGALSNATGRIAISWTAQDAAGSPGFEMTWRESGGPPVRRNARTGFGRLVIERMAAEGLSAAASLDFDAEGVYWRLTGPLKEIIVAA